MPGSSPGTSSARSASTTPGVTEIAIVGLSLSGLAAAYTATRHPAVFRAAVCQSPSFWWERGRFAEELPRATQGGPEFWICVGSRETEAGLVHPPSGLRQGLTQVAGCVFTAAALRAEGYGVSYREYDGGHDPDCRRDDLSLALSRVWRRGRPPSAGRPRRAIRPADGTTGDEPSA
jgi:enterochelin esterase-like enzyme